MNSTDLAGFFRRFVATQYAAGVDDAISRFVGPHYESSQGVEAELDVQYIMGVVRTPPKKTTTNKPQ